MSSNDFRSFRPSSLDLILLDRILFDLILTENLVKITPEPHQPHAPESPTKTFNVEHRSIGFVPTNERYGRPLNQFTLWFGSNLQITAVVTGALAVVLGGDVVWSIIGLLLGQVLGGAVMALHSVQGPRLGLPQMISSRAQFGVYGAMIPLVLVIVMYTGFAGGGAVLAGQAVAGILHSAHWLGIAIFGAATAVIAIIGYRLIHIMGRLSSIIGFLAFTYLTYRLLASADLGMLFGNSSFSLASFLLAMSLSASWQIAYGPYVADYSRYLPADTPAWKTFGATLAGSVIASQWSMTFGVLAAELAGSAFVDNEVGYIVSLGGAGVIATLLYCVIALGKLTVNVLNAYGGFMSLVTTVTGFLGHREISQRARVGCVTLIMLCATVIALLASDNFLASFSTFLLFLLAFFTPWSAINLVDFYFVTKEHYDVPALSDPDGRYGRWNTVALTTYAIGLIAQLPFLYTAFYSGPMVAVLGHTDISWIVGLIVPGTIYYVWARRDRSMVPDRLILPSDEPAPNVHHNGLKSTGTDGILTSKAGYSQRDAREEANPARNEQIDVL
ncbi:cytosine permease [Rhodococcus sp. WB9]|uniref:purine-cytosine permease family protein n=1 Tax=Rhodococcus sp. WB9 TaxID=2594007 RepID=UPI001185EA4E|nr:cytosine permease [Rhodococcus sp. WB9]QDQ95337.1 cytosine permease [Rhodococcus sp. WB9]